MQIAVWGVHVKIKMNSLYIGIALMCMMLPASLKSLPFGIEITVLAMVVCICVQHYFYW